MTCGRAATERKVVTCRLWHAATSALCDRETGCAEDWAAPCADFHPGAPALTFLPTALFIYHQASHKSSNIWRVSTKNRAQAASLLALAGVSDLETSSAIPTASSRSAGTQSLAAMAVCRVGQCCAGSGTYVAGCVARQQSLRSHQDLSAHRVPLTRRRSSY